MRIKSLICKLIGHKRQESKLLSRKFRISVWKIKCGRCKQSFEYESPMCRLIGEEIKLNFNPKYL
jgi:rRNA maturation endonuclease Nob1